MNNFGYVLASKMLVENRQRVRFMYREKGKNGDSGWRFFCGNEDQAYADDPNNIAIYDVDTIIAVDKSIVPYLNSTSGTAYEREDENALFTVSKDFGFGEGRV
jgi:hypothetical protein